MSSNVKIDVNQTVKDYRPVVKNIVSNVSAPSAFPAAAKSAQKFIFKPENNNNLQETAKNVLSGVKKEKFDVIFNTVKKASKENLKKSANLAYGGVVAGKSGGKHFSRIFSSLMHKLKFSKKMKVFGIITAIAVAAYIYCKDKYC